MTKASSQKHPIIRTALRLKCPACAEGNIFKTFFQVHPRCHVCGFDINGHDAADGPAFFAITLIGTLVCAGAVIVEIKHSPSLTMHMAIWTPLIIGGSLFSLRWFKSIFIAVQYRHGLGKYDKKNK